MAKRRGKGTIERGTTPGPAPGRELSPADQKKLVETALELIETFYVHLPLKRSMYAVNPLQRLKLLRRRSELQIFPLQRREFFNELLSIFCQLRDLHTNFVLPEPFRSNFAYLPFDLERCVGDSGEDLYIVSQLRTEGEEPIDPDFHRGSIVTYWNGTRIHLVVAANAERESGSNPAARLAQGLTALTLRWLGQSLPPDEDWVDLIFHPDLGAESKQIRLHWKVRQREQAPGGGAASAIATAQGDNIWRVGMDERGESERQVRRYLFNEARKGTPRVKHFGSAANTSVAEWAQEVFPACGNVRPSSGLFAYVRIKTFNVPNDRPFVDEFVRIISQLSQDGLILDLRGNGGGTILFGERLLQLLTPRAIDPARFSFLNSARTQYLTSQHRFLQPWRNSIAESIETGTEYSQGFPLAPIDLYNDIGQIYQGPVLLIIDALCYSTTDIFAAGFQDHKIGVILGVDQTTGAGGANVWDYSSIAELLGDPERFPPSLPDQASFRFAARRVTRVGENSGVLLEDLGVKADEFHRLTRRDVLERNRDLIERAAKILKKQSVQRLIGERQKKGSILIRYQNLDRIDAYVDGHPARASLKVERSPRLKRRTLNLPPMIVASAKELRLEGYRSDSRTGAKLVAATRLPL